jgi:hypothetical protein
MGYKALYSSMSIKARNVLDSCDPNYIVDGQPSMICLYRLIVQNSILDTNKTPTMARKKLHNMATILKDMHYNIEDFLQEVTDVIDVIISHQQTVEEHDLIIQLFQGLETVPDERFQRYLDIRKDEYNKGQFSNAAGQALPYQLMALVKVEYQSRVEDKNWCGPDAKQEIISALQTQVTVMSTQLEIIKNTHQNKKSTDTRKKGGGKPAAAGPRTFEKWETTKVGATVQHANAKGKMKTYNWCPKHGRYVIHDPAKCNLETPQHPIAAHATTIEQQDDNDGDSSDDE